VISLQHKKAAAVLSFLLSSIPRIEAGVLTLPSIVAAALHHEASAWILKNGLIFFALRLVTNIHSIDLVA